MEGRKDIPEKLLKELKVDLEALNDTNGTDKW